MKILARVLALFLIMPVVELALLMQVDKLIGFWPTIGIILFTGLLGGYLAKREGLAVWKRLNQRLGEGGLPGNEAVDGVIILCAGALLITPGVLTDFFGFMGLFPVSRALIRKIVKKQINKAMERGSLNTVGYGSWESPYPDTGYQPNEMGEPIWEGEAQEQPQHLDRSK